MMNSQYYHPHRRRASGRRSRNFLPFIVFSIIITLVVWGLMKLFDTIFDGEQSNSLSAEIQILKGQAEFSLPESDNWTPSYTEQKFFTGDSIRTKSNSKAVLNIAGGNTIFVDENTKIEITNLEEKSSNYKNILITISEGQIWARISDEDLTLNPKSKFIIATDKLNLNVRGTILNIGTTSNVDTIRLVKGSVDVDVLDKTKANTENVKVGVGQKLIVNKNTFNNVQTGKEVLEIIDSSFIESEWHIQNLGKFYPQEAAQIRRRIEISAAKENQAIVPEVQEEVKDPNALASPEILSPLSGEIISSDIDVLKIEGSAPPEATLIIVNGFTLTKFQPGDRKWSYFAAKKFGTLVPGENTFSVYAITRDGTKSEPSSITITYEGVPQQTLIKDLQSTAATTHTAKAAQIENDFKAPIINKPSPLANGETHKTSEDVVTISGNVAPGTQTVKVNGYKLKKFKPGNTEFTYIASAKYGVRSNLLVGENKYEVVALGPDGKQASTTIIVIYTPRK